MKRIRFAIAVTVVAGIAVASPAFAQHPDGHMPQPKSSVTAANFDHEYVDMMIPHHQQAIAMAEKAAQKAQSAGVKSLASRIIADQNKDLAALDRLKRAAKSETPGSTHGMKPMDMSHLDAASGPAFDTMFLKMMSEHHQEALDMSNEELKRGRQASVKAFARNTIKKQQAEIAEMKRIKP